MGMVNEPVPVAGFALNFSSIPRIAPPPRGKFTAGKGGGSEVFEDGFAASECWRALIGVAMRFAFELNVGQTKSHTNACNTFGFVVVGEGKDADSKFSTWYGRLLKI